MVDSNLCFNYCMHVSLASLAWFKIGLITFWLYCLFPNYTLTVPLSPPTARIPHPASVDTEGWLSRPGPTGASLLGVSSLASGRAEIKSWGSSPGLLLLYHYTTLCFARCQSRAVGQRRWQEVKSSGYRTAMIVSTHCQLLCPPIATIAPQLPPLPARPLPDIQDYQIPNWLAHHCNVWNSHSSTDFTCHHLRRS